MAKNKIFEELKADPAAWAAYKRLKAGKGDNKDIALVMPYIPEFRRSMENAENARAEGRTTKMDQEEGMSDVSVS